MLERNFWNFFFGGGGDLSSGLGSVEAMCLWVDKQNPICIQNEN